MFVLSIPFERKILFIFHFLKLLYHKILILSSFIFLCEKFNGARAAKQVALWQLARSDSFATKCDIFFHIFCGTNSTTCLYLCVIATDIFFYNEYIFNNDYRVARSALWGITKAKKEELSQLQIILNKIIDQAMQTENSSVRRLSLNIIERLEMHEEDLRTDFLDFCFEHMTDIEEFPGIQSVCLKLAYRMCKFYPELMDELKRTLEAMEIDYYKPAVKSVRSKILSGKIEKKK